MTSPSRLIVADSEKDANMLYAVGMFVPDPFIWFQHKGRTFAVFNDLEIDRARQQARVDRVLPYSRYQKQPNRAASPIRNCTRCSCACCGTTTSPASKRRPIFPSAWPNACAASRSPLPTTRFSPVANSRPLAKSRRWPTRRRWPKKAWPPRSTEGDLDPALTTVDLSHAKVRRPGRDVSLVTYGNSLPKCLAAAEALAADGIEAEVVDLRVLRPLDMASVVESVTRTHRVVIVDEGWKSRSLSAEVAARLCEDALYELDAPVRRICSHEVPVPYAAHLELATLPQVDAIVAAARAQVRPR